MNINKLQTGCYYQQQKQFLNQNTSKQSFGASPILTSAFSLINQHEIIGVSLIDLLSMVIPRSIIDFTRSSEAGRETAIRESSSTATHAAIGLSGLGAASLLSQGLKKKKYNVDFKAITANNDTIDFLANTFNSVYKQNLSLPREQLFDKFFTTLFNDVQSLGGNENIKNSQLWFKLSEKQQKAITETLSQKLTEAGSKSKLSSQTLQNLLAKMNMDLPSTQTLRVNVNNKTLETTGLQLLEDSYSMAKAFWNNNVLRTFRTSSDVGSNAFIKDLKRLTLGKTILGMSAICAAALSVQSINRQLTKAKTGKAGFVGDPNYGKNNGIIKTKDNLFYPAKALAAMAMGFFIFKTVNAKSLSDFISKIQFKGSLPTMNQIKVVYGSTILGRLFAAEDRNELRESAFRDFLGYTNFLVIGSLVTKMFIAAKDKSLLNYDYKLHGKGFWNKILHASVKTHEEVINSGLKDKVFNGENLKSLKEMFNNNLIPKGSEVAKKLSVLNKAKLLGMGYACVALGIVVPLINKYMTEVKAKKQQAEHNKLFAFENSDKMSEFLKVRG